MAAATAIHVSSRLATLTDTLLGLLPTHCHPCHFLGNPKAQQALQRTTTCTRNSSSLPHNRQQPCSTRACIRTARPGHCDHRSGSGSRCSRRQLLPVQLAHLEAEPVRRWRGPCPAAAGATLRCAGSRHSDAGSQFGNGRGRNSSCLQRAHQVCTSAATLPTSSPIRPLLRPQNTQADPAAAASPPATTAASSAQQQQQGQLPVYIEDAATQAFLDWARAAGIAFAKARVAAFGGERGLAAAADIAADDVIVSVPRGAALTLPPKQRCPCPEFVAPAYWDASPWCVPGWAAAAACVCLSSMRGRCDEQPHNSATRHNPFARVSSAPGRSGLCAWRCGCCTSSAAARPPPLRPGSRSCRAAGAHPPAGARSSCSRCSTATSSTWPRSSRQSGGSCTTSLLGRATPATRRTPQRSRCARSCAAAAAPATRRAALHARTQTCAVSSSVALPRSAGSDSRGRSLACTRTHGACPARARAPATPDPHTQEFFRALSLVRSRTFSGPYVASTLAERGRLAGLVAALVAANTALGGELSKGLGAAAAVFIFNILYELLLSNKLRQYALCPLIDFANHASANTVRWRPRAPRTRASQRSDA